MRERLIEMCENLILSCKSSLCADCEHNKIDYPLCMSVHFADYLLDNGVIVPPCKVGDIVYKVYDIESVHRQILELEVLMIEVGIQRKVCLKTTKKHRYNFDKATFEDFGKTVFTNREDAEKALRGGDDK